MNKKLMAAIFIMVFCFTSTTACAKQASDDNLKEAYINIDVVWRSSTKGKEDLKKIDAIIQNTKGEIDKLNNEMKTLKEEFDKATEKTKKEEVARNMEMKRRQIIELSTIKNQEIEMMKNEAQQKFIQEVVPIINKYRDEQGIMVVNRYSPNLVISVDPSIDITDEILELYNQQK